MGWLFKIAFSRKIRFHGALVIGFVAFCANASRAEESQNLSTKARYAYLTETSSGTILFSKNADEAFSAASLSKLMTLDVVFDALQRNEVSLETSFPVSMHAWQTGGAPSRTATMFAALKSNIRVEDLIKGVAVQAANDACIILAEGLSGDEVKFAKRMTERARTLGLPKAIFGNATGLPDQQSTMSAREVAVLAQHLQKTYPDFYRYLAQPEFQWNKIKQSNRNPLLKFNIGVDGLALGYVEGEGYSIAASAEQNGKRLILVLAGLSSHQERTEEAKRILEWGFDAFEIRRIFDKGQIVGKASVYGGRDSEVELVLHEPVSLYVPRYGSNDLTAKIVYQWPLSAPIEADRQAATLRLYSGSQLLKEEPLYTRQKVALGTLQKRAWDAASEGLQTIFFSWFWTDTKAQ